MSNQVPSDLQIVALVAANKRDHFLTTRRDNTRPTTRHSAAQILSSEFTMSVFVCCWCGHREEITAKELHLGIVRAATERRMSTGKVRAQARVNPLVVAR